MFFISLFLFPWITVSFWGELLWRQPDLQWSSRTWCTGVFMRFSWDRDTPGERGDPPRASSTLRRGWQGMGIVRVIETYRRNPWEVWVTRAGNQHVMRQPEHGAAVCVEGHTGSTLKPLPALPGRNGIHPAESHGVSKLCSHHVWHSFPDKAPVGTCSPPGVRLQDVPCFYTSTRQQQWAPCERCTTQVKELLRLVPELQ